MNKILKQSHIAMPVFVKNHLMHGLLYRSTNLPDMRDSFNPPEVWQLS